MGANETQTHVGANESHARVGANEACVDWELSCRIDWSKWDSEGHIDLYQNVDGMLMDDFSYAYSWQAIDGTSFAASGRNDSPAFAFFAPAENSTYLVTSTAIAPDGEAKSITSTIEVGQRAKPQAIAKRQIASDAQTSIAVRDVSMVFNIASEQFNSLKEYFIAASRHELKFKAFRALDHISFEVKRGEAFGLVGTNGSGKSTMLKIIAGVLDATEGTCEVRGNIAPLIELGAGFDMELTAQENIYLNGALLGYTHEFIEEHFDDIVSFAELDGFMEMPLKNYSSGMVARIAFAIATAAEPDILIVDETLSVGDFIFQRKCEQRIQQMISGGNVTVLLVSHSIDLVESICDRVCWIDKGHMRMIGPTMEVCTAYRNSSQ